MEWYSCGCGSGDSGDSGNVRGDSGDDNFFLVFIQ